MPGLFGLVGGEECQRQVEPCRHGSAWSWRGVGRGGASVVDCNRATRLGRTTRPPNLRAMTESSR